MRFKHSHLLFKISYNFLSHGEINSDKKPPELDDKQVESTSLLMPFESENQATKQTKDISESPNHLKRTQGFTDLPNIDDFSPVTFFRSVQSNQPQQQPLQSEQEPPKQESLAVVQRDTADDSNSSCYLEEKKVVIPGIKVRAAKVSKLVQIFMDSFDKTGKVQASTDFPRVFILMHKWFMESIHLIDILFDLYNLYNQYQDYYTQKADKEYYAHQQLKICYAFKLVELKSINPLFHNDLWV